MAPHTHLQVSFQLLSLHCRPHYWWSGTGLDLWLGKVYTVNCHKIAQIVYRLFFSENLESSRPAFVESEQKKSLFIVLSVDMVKLPFALWSFLMKKTITITCTTTEVTITTAKTLPRAATTASDDDPLLSPSATAEDSSITIARERENRINGILTFSSSVGEGSGGAPSRVEDCDSDVIASATPQTRDGVAVLVS